MKKSNVWFNLSMKNNKEKTTGWSAIEVIGISVINTKFRIKTKCKHDLPIGECKEKECLVEDVMES